MDWSKFPPSILALAKAYGIVLSVAFGSIRTVQFGVQAYGRFTESTNTTSAFPGAHGVVRYSHQAEPCPTCLIADVDDHLLDDYDRPLEIDQLVAQQSNPGHVIVFTSSLASNSTWSPDSSNVSTTRSAQLSEPTPVAPGTYDYDTIFFWLDMILSWLMSPFSNFFFHAIQAGISSVVKPRRWKIWLIVCERLASICLSRAVVALFKRLRKNQDVQPANPAASEPNAQLTTGTNTTQDAMLEKFSRIIGEHDQDLATLMSAMQRLLVAQYGNACTWKMMSGAGEAWQPKDAKASSNVQANLGKDHPAGEAQHFEARPEDNEKLAELKNEEDEEEAQRSESLGKSAEAIDLKDQRCDREVRQSKMTNGESETRSDLDTDREETIVGVLEDTFQLGDDSEEALGGSPSREVKDLLDMERSKWSDIKHEYVAIIEDQAQQINLLRSHLHDEEEQVAANRDFFGTIEDTMHEKDQRIEELQEFADQRVALIEHAEAKYASQIKELQDTIAELRKCHGEHKCGLSVDINDYDWQEIRQMAALINLPNGKPKAAVQSKLNLDHRHRRLGPHWHQQLIFDNNTRENDFQASSSQSNQPQNDQIRPNWFIHRLFPATKTSKEYVRTERRQIPTDEISPNASDLHSTSKLYRNSRARSSPFTLTGPVFESILASNNQNRPRRLSPASLQYLSDEQLSSLPDWHEYLATTNEDEHSQHSEKENEVNGENGIKDTGEQDHYDAPTIDEDTSPNENEMKRKSGIKDAIEQADQNTRQSGSGSPSNEGERKENNGIKEHDSSHDRDLDPGDGEVEGKVEEKKGIKGVISKNVDPQNSGVQGKQGIEDASELDHDGDSWEGESLLHQECVTKLIFPSDGIGSPEQLVAVKAFTYVEWQIEYLKAGYGTPEDPMAKHIPDDTPASTTEGKEQAKWREARICWYQKKAITLKERITNLRVGDAFIARVSSNTRSQNGAVGNGESQAQSTTHADASLSPNQAKPQPKAKGPLKNKMRKLQHKVANAKNKG